MSTGSGAGAIHGFFFTNDPDEAQEYAISAGRKVVSGISNHEKEVKRLRMQAEHLERLALRSNSDKDWRAYEEAMAAWEKFETDATYEDPNTNVHVIAAYLSIQNPLETSRV